MSFFNSFMIFCGPTFFKIDFLKKIFQEHYQSIKLFVILSGLIWVQTICKDYQQMTKFVAGRQRAISLHVWYFCMFLLTCDFLYKINFCPYDLSAISAVCQIVQIQIRSPTLSVLILGKTACTCYQQWH